MSHKSCTQLLNTRNHLILLGIFSTSVLSGSDIWRHSREAHAHHFPDATEHRVVAGAGHNLTQETPLIFAKTVLDLVHF